jgi:23S rRNA (adenine1618-N6)-methyltransferase
LKTSNQNKEKQTKSSYDFDALCKVYSPLTSFVFENAYKTKTIDFANPKAVKALNTALLKKYYGISYWEFPDSNLCPPIPGRVAYIDCVSQLLKKSKITQNISVLDIGTGATCIYPILGQSIYKWKFIGTDIDKDSLKTAQQIINKNSFQQDIKLRHQANKMLILKGILNAEDSFSVSICNPPFYKSEEEAFEATSRKLNGLNKPTDTVVRNFAGTQNELIYEGGEKAFLHNYLYESSLFKNQCFWFTSLVSKKDLVKGIQQSLVKLGATDVKVINMTHGNKISRIVAWTFLTKDEQNLWIQ